MRGRLGQTTLIFDPMVPAGWIIPEEFLAAIRRICGCEEERMATGRFQVDVSGQIQELRDIKQSLVSLRDRLDAVIESLKTVQVDFIPDQPPPPP